MRQTIRISTVITLAVALFAPVSAFAAPPKDADESARVGAKSGSTIYDFEDDNVDGEVLSPQGANISSRGRNNHASLITIRPHCIQQLIKMANDI
jgi:hypothetical protein